MGKGTVLKRVSMHGRGRSGMITKPRSHVKVIVMEQDKVDKQVHIHEGEAPWKRRRRVAVEKYQKAMEAGIL